MTAEMMRDHVAILSVETADQLTSRDIHEMCERVLKSGLNIIASLYIHNKIDKRIPGN